MDILEYVDIVTEDFFIAHLVCYTSENLVNTFLLGQRFGWNKMR